MGVRILLPSQYFQRNMNLLTTLPLLLLLAPCLLAQEVPQCRSCCPDVEDPAPETMACDTLDSHLAMMKEAIDEAGCDDSSDRESEEVCHAITMKAIPPCMLIEGTNEQAKCLADAAQDIEEELGIDEEAGAEVVAKCKCEAFKYIREALSSVRDMMCPPSDSDRKPRNYYGYGANTLWFQYILCQQESIPSLACWLFTSGWNQAEFGQYYLYDNLLNSEEGGLLDGDLLPILALSGGLGFGGNSYAPAHGGHPVYRREVTCEDGETAAECKNRNRRSTTTEDCNDGETAAECEKRKRRSPTTEDCTVGETAAECINRKRRSAINKDCEDGKTSAECRKRRSTTKACKIGEVMTTDGCKRISSRKRRSDKPCEEGDASAECRKRRSDTEGCNDGETAAECSNRKRRSTATIKAPCKEGYVLTPSGCKFRNRRSPSTCKDDDESPDCV